MSGSNASGFTAERAIKKGDIVQLGHSRAHVVPAQNGAPIGIALESGEPGDIVAIQVNGASGFVMTDPHLDAALARQATREFNRERESLRRAAKAAARAERVDPVAELDRLGAALDELDV